MKETFRKLSQYYALYKIINPEDKTNYKTMIIILFITCNLLYSNLPLIR